MILSNRSIYRKIAKENGVTVAEVKHDMQEALDHAFKNPPQDGVTKAYQDKVSRKGEVPTPEEFIRYSANEVKKQRKNQDK